MGKWEKEERRGIASKFIVLSRPLNDDDDDDDNINYRALDTARYLRRRD